jgi:hypothetical protein
MQGCGTLTRIAYCDVWKFIQRLTFVRFYVICMMNHCDIRNTIVDKGHLMPAYSRLSKLIA